MQIARDKKGCKMQVANTGSRPVRRSPGLNKFIYVGINVLDSHFHGNDRREIGNDRNREWE